MPHDASASCVDAICSNHGSTLMTSLPAHTINTTSELSVQRIIPNIQKYTMYLTSAAIMGDSQSHYGTLHRPHSSAQTHSSHMFYSQITTPVNSYNKLEVTVRSINRNYKERKTCLPFHLLKSSWMITSFYSKLKDAERQEIFRWWLKDLQDPPAGAVSCRKRNKPHQALSVVLTRL